MNKDDWCRAFVDRMIAYAGNGRDTIIDDNGDVFDLRKYAEEVAPIYWDDEDTRNDGPVECVNADLDCWGER